MKLFNCINLRQWDYKNIKSKIKGIEDHRKIVKRKIKRKSERSTVREREAEEGDRMKQLHKEIIYTERERL